jgi:tRNA(His) 5'-end guanylyltransferase
MLHTASDLLKSYPCSSVYTESDEISMIFPAIQPHEGGEVIHPFGGRVLKVSSLAASYASVRFNHYMQLQLTSDANDKVRRTIINVYNVYVG